MVKEEKTIDGFPVRSANDSALVARSKAKKIASNKPKKNVKTVAENDPLVRRSAEKAGAVKKAAQKVAVAPKAAAQRGAVAIDMKPAKKPAKRRKISRAKTAAMFAAEPEAFNIEVEPKAPEEEIEIVDEEQEFTREIDDERLEEELFGKATANAEAHEEFLAPVETFDMGTKEAATKDGMISEVGDEEVKDMKKSKRELKENAKKAKLEQKRLAKLKKTEKKKSSGKKSSSSSDYMGKKL